MTVPIYLQVSWDWRISCQDTTTIWQEAVNYRWRHQPRYNHKKQTCQCHHLLVIRNPTITQGSLANRMYLVCNKKRLLGLEFNYISVLAKRSIRPSLVLLLCSHFLQVQFFCFHYGPIPPQLSPATKEKAIEKMSGRTSYPITGHLLTCLKSLSKPYSPPLAKEKFQRDQVPTLLIWARGCVVWTSPHWQMLQWGGNYGCIYQEQCGVSCFVLAFACLFAILVGIWSN